jgi:exonuclease III
MIQETHLVNTDYLKLVWKQNYLSNCVRTNSAGVMILFNKRFQTKLIHKDSEGRLIIVVVEDGDDKFILVNAYFPNDHRQGIVFADEMYSKI